MRDLPNPIAIVTTFTHNVPTQEVRGVVTVGVRELKGRLSQYLRRVKTGERLAITERGRTIALLSPPAERGGDRQIEAMLQQRVAQWDGGKPAGSVRPARVRGAGVADAVIEDRR